MSVGKQSLVVKLRRMIERAQRDRLRKPYIEGLIDAYVAAGGRSNPEKLAEKR